ncbi:Inositol-tetrakisphosphate 1-kinase 3 [Zea mays]|uniref:Inositol-tetrakisphosphate 1-kinase 3 n=1 Tax=Zea mays TaxID=4577 RepID=A0A1D6PFL6_MAIZE|nr:Inositol-tetrakisphosphate 1-kinase 3 [Zea mays]
MESVLYLLMSLFPSQNKALLMLFYTRLLGRSGRRFWSQCYRFPLRRGLSFFHFLKDYHEEHPEVTVLDPPNAIEHLNNRQSMLEEVADLNLSNFYGEVCIPRQLVITKDPSSIPTSVAMAGLTLPLVAKPLVVDGTSKGHELYLAYDEASLSMLDPPLVLQEFINHGMF